MSDHDSASTASTSMLNGAGAAAVLAAGIGSFSVALFALIADKVAGFKNTMIFYRPTGPLSGVTTLAIVIWLISWAVLHLRWRNRSIAVAWTNAAAFVLLILSLLLTFPPIADLL